ncbi:phospholipase D family protein [Psychroflexus aestuariivivens]|uniref:phospholipase D family protein n=1 Tax=Psychroflexus aestuariivivens TaxID=1795040 RepID=UPI000FDB2F88|nr:phospholipase D family protein [Psychroflexus aestuariivivens]
MARFLKTSDFNDWLLRLISTAQKELILIVPYIKTSKEVNEALKKADHNGVNIVIVYRENKLSRNEKLNFLELETLNLLHHPNIHCKSYYNGDLMIIGSMNLHSYSQNNNREMGALFSKHLLTEGGDIREPVGFENTDEDFNFIDSSLTEFKEIINSSELEYQSENAKKKPFTFDILKTKFERSLEYANSTCDKLNKVFKNKKFIPITFDDKTYSCVCENYFDDIQVLYDENKFIISINKPEDYLKHIFDHWKKSYNEFEFLGFKYYWKYHSTGILIYKDTYRYNWEPHFKSFESEMDKFKEGIDLIIKKYRRVKEDVRRLRLIE